MVGAADRAEGRGDSDEFCNTNQDSPVARFRYILCGLRLREGRMSPESSQKVWIPVCCGRVMRFNRFLKQDGEAYGSMVCTICNKNIILEQEEQPATDAYGEGTRMLTVIGTPKPPTTDRPKCSSAFHETSSDAHTL